MDTQEKQDLKLINQYNKFMHRFYGSQPLYQTNFKDFDELTMFDESVTHEGCYALDLIFAGYIINDEYPYAGLWEVYARLLQLEKRGYIGDVNEGSMYVNKPQEVLDFIAPLKLKYKGFGDSDERPKSILTISKYGYTHENGHKYSHFVLGHPNNQPECMIIDTIRGGSNSVRKGKLHSLRQISINPNS